MRQLVLSLGLSAGLVIGSVGVTSVAFAQTGAAGTSGSTGASNQSDTSGTGSQSGTGGGATTPSTLTSPGTSTPGSQTGSTGTQGTTGAGAQGGAGQAGGQGAPTSAQNPQTNVPGLACATVNPATTADPVTVSQAERALAGFFAETARNWSIMGFDSVAQARAVLGNAQTDWLTQTTALACGRFRGGYQNANWITGTGWEFR